MSSTDTKDARTPDMPERRRERTIDPLTAALDAEIARFELFSTRLWFSIAVLGIGIGIFMATFLTREIGIAVTGIAVFYALYCVPVAWLIKTRGKLAGLFAMSADLVEATVPWTFLLLLTWAEGAEYALASWAPPLFFCLVLFQNALRLRPRGVFIVGFLGCLAFPVLYWYVVRQRVDEGIAGYLIYQSPLQVSRTALLVLTTIMCGVGAGHLRKAILRAEAIARQKDLFGKYRLLDEIARGGMGEVIEALYCPEGGFERRVAIKRIHKHLAEKPRFVRQFRTEAELCSRLAHPNVVQVLDFGRIEDTYFLAMEFVDGMTLGQLLKRADERGVPIPEHVVGLILRDLLDGLDHAHRVARGSDGAALRVIHRDLCPQNILLSKNGEVKVSDFGVARALKDAEASETKTVVGHTAYLAPEQARALSLDERVDLFAVGVIAWEMLAARRLFLRGTDAATIQALLNDPIPKLGSYREVDEGWDAFLKQAIQREPSRRFQSATEMAAAIDVIPTSRKEGAGRELGRMVERLAIAADEPEDAEVSETRGATKTLLEGPPVA